MAEGIYDLKNSDGGYIYTSPEKEQEKRVLESLIKVVDEYSQSYNTMSAEDIIKDIESNPDKITALTNAINKIGKKQELNLEGAKGRYEAYLSDKHANIHVDSLVAKNDKNSLLSFLGGQALYMSDLYQDHQNLRREDSTYSLNVTNYNNIEGEWLELVNQHGDSAGKYYDNWEIKRDDIYKELEGTPMERMMTTDAHSDIYHTLEGLKNCRKNEQQKSKQTEKKQVQEEQVKKEETKDTQLQVNNKNSVLQILKNKLKEIGESFKNGFGGIKAFDNEIMKPAEEQLGNISQENALNEKELISNVKEFIDKNVTQKLADLKEKGLGSFEGLKERITGTQDLEELSKNFLDAKENGDTDQMARLSKQIVKIGTMQEPQRYKEMSQEEMLNFKLSEGLAALDTETYKQTLSAEQLEKSETILEAMQISTREKYLKNDFNTNEQLLTNEFSNLYNQGYRENRNYEKLTAIGYKMEEVNSKGNAAQEGKYNLKLLEEFKEISERFTGFKNEADSEFQRNGKPSDDCHDFGTARNQLNKVSVEYREDIKNQDLTKAKEYIGNLDYGDKYYANVPEELFEQKEEQKVPWEGSNSNR